VRYTITILFLLGLHFTALAALVWEPAGQSQVVFADRPSVVRQDIRNDGDKAMAQAVRLRMIQLSTSTAAPVPGWELKKQVEVPAGQTLRTMVEVSLPKVTNPTRFRITWNDESDKVMGSTDLVGCPADLFQPLRLVSTKRPIGLLGDSGGLATLLRQQGCELRELSSVEELKNFDGSVLLVAWAGRGKEELENFGRLAAQHAKDRGGRVVWLVEPDNLPLSPVPAVCVFTHGEGTVVVSTGIKLAEAAQSPLIQLRLVWLVELALATEENRLLLLGRLMNL
jgi:hypothetical protein